MRDIECKCNLHVTTGNTQSCKLQYRPVCCILIPTRLMEQEDSLAIAALFGIVVVYFYHKHQVKTGHGGIKPLQVLLVLIDEQLGTSLAPFPPADGQVVPRPGGAVADPGVRPPAGARSHRSKRNKSKRSKRSKRDDQENKKASDTPPTSDKIGAS